MIFVRLRLSGKDQCDTLLIHCACSIVIIACDETALLLTSQVSHDVSDVAADGLLCCNINKYLLRNKKYD